MAKLNAESTVPRSVCHQGSWLVKGLLVAFMGSFVRFIGDHDSAEGGTNTVHVAASHRATSRPNDEGAVDLHQVVQGRRTGLFEGQSVLATGWRIREADRAQQVPSRLIGKRGRLQRVSRDCNPGGPWFYIWARLAGCRSDRNSGGPERNPVRG